MFSDPITITVNAVPKVMPRTGTGSQSAIYTLPDELYRLEISHRANQRDGKPRLIHTVKFVERAIVTNPLDSTNDWDETFISVQWDRPNVGFTSTQIGHNWTGFKAWADSTALGKILGRES